jgi:uncharacterized protein YhbP (UPF0306 family)
MLDLSLFLEEPEPQRLAQVIGDTFEATPLCSLATADSASTPHISIVYYSFTPNCRIIFVSAPTSAHATNIRERRRVAISVVESNQTWGEPHRGLQMMGTADEVTEDCFEALFRSYSTRFPGILLFARTRAELLQNFDSLLFCVEIERVKVIDERALNDGWRETNLQRGERRRLTAGSGA